MTQDFFIFTEAYNCSDILKNCLKSFYKYHDDVIYVFGTENDIKSLSEFNKIVPIVIGVGTVVDRAYSHGHLGTARIFSEAILKYSQSKYLIHFDSDLIFKKECLSNIKQKFLNGYDLVGPVRPYKHNLNGRDDIRHLQDVVATCFFGFNKDKITSKNLDELMYQINGMPFEGNPTLDFFDYVSFDIIKNGGVPFYFDYEETGGPSQTGNRVNKYGKLNEDIDCGDWFIHFAGIGSGSKIYKNGLQQTHSGYANWALKRYSLYKKLIENVDIPNIQYDSEKLELYRALI
jgi:hypothetical protein